MPLPRCFSLKLSGFAGILPMYDCHGTWSKGQHCGDHFLSFKVKHDLFPLLLHLLLIKLVLSPCHVPKLYRCQIPSRIAQLWPDSIQLALPPYSRSMGTYRNWLVLPKSTISSATVCCLKCRAIKQSAATTKLLGFASYGERDSVSPHLLYFVLVSLTDGGCKQAVAMQPTQEISHFFFNLFFISVEVGASPASFPTDGPGLSDTSLSIEKTRSLYPLCVLMLQLHWRYCTISLLTSQPPFGW